MQQIHQACTYLGHPYLKFPFCFYKARLEIGSGSSERNCFIVIVAVYQLHYKVLMSICVSFHLCVCVHDNSKYNGSIHLKLEQVVVYENSSDEFDIGHCMIKVKVTA